MDKFDRELQRELLLALYAAFPNHLQENVYKELEEKFGQLNFIANIFSRVSRRQINKLFLSAIRYNI